MHVFEFMAEAFECVLELFQIVIDVIPSLTLNQPQNTIIEEDNHEHKQLRENQNNR